ncbi:DUF2497 domain-containing protein [Roseococcus sp. YIM B11640]|uniref:DUF2497 domain-containing protein n=1 Tax=Roseococcus sp. YIM B11640 TaxID=3133973 RepID=UPI003C7B38EB
MDDILASIRKILNEDEQAAAQTVVAPVAPVAEAIQLTPEMMVTPAAPVAEAAPPPVAESMPEPAPVLAAAPSSPSESILMSLEPQQPETLVDASAAAAAASAFSQLSRLAQDRAVAVTPRGPSLEEVIREEIRPMLKAWLDAHLPATVERLVRAEIERVMSRQG